MRFFDSLRSLRMTGLAKTCHSEEPVRTLVTWESVSSFSIFNFPFYIC